MFAKFKLIKDFYYYDEGAALKLPQGVANPLTRVLKAGGKNLKRAAFQVCSMPKVKLFGIRGGEI
jgi:hypothetical protein